jgi:hypothetical protein
MIPDPNPYPTPTPTPRPVSEGYVSPADYVSAYCTRIKTVGNLDETLTLGQMLEKLEAVKNVLVAAEL